MAAEPQRAAPENVAAQPEAPTSEEQRSCLDEQQLFSALQEAVGGDQLRAVAMRGQDFAELRNIDFAGLNDLATQGNSAAMATLGVQNILRANRQTPADAAAFLDDPRQIDSTALEGIYPGDYQNYSPEDLLALQEANYWLYQAALNGRIGALHDYGAVIGAQLRGPVGMKWLSQEEFDALATTDQALFSPDMVYSAVANRLAAPELEFVDNSSLPEELKSRRAAIIERLTEEFAQDLEYAELPIPEPWTNAQIANDLRGRACPGVLEPERDFGGEEYDITTDARDGEQ